MQPPSLHTQHSSTTVRRLHTLGKRWPGWHNAVTPLVQKALQRSVHAWLWWHVLHLIVQRLHVHRPVVNLDPAGHRVTDRQAGTGA